MNKQIDFLDLLTIMSFIIGVQNLFLNEEQVSALDKHLSNQDHILKDQQFEMLEKIIKQNEEIIKLIKEGLIHAQEND